MTITDTGGVDRGASATALVSVKGGVTDITVTSAGAGYLTPGLKKFVDTLPGLGAGAANNLGQYIPIAVPDTTTYPTSTLTAGSHAVFASYSGDVNFSASSATLTQTVNLNPSTTTLSSNVNPSASGQLVTFTASVNPPRRPAA